MRRALPPLSLIATTAAMLLLGAGCFFGLGGEPLTLAEYFDQVDKADQEAADKFEQIGQEISQTQDVEQIKDGYAEFPPAIDGFIQAVEDLNPPDEGQDAHDEMLDATRALHDEAENVVNDMEGATSVEELRSALNSPEFSAAGQSFDEACLALQAVADDAQIDATLGCAESQEDGDTGPTPTDGP